LELGHLELFANGVATGCWEVGPLNLWVQVLPVKKLDIFAEKINL
jgi:hypothetical protein